MSLVRWIRRARVRMQLGAEDDTPIVGAWTSYEFRGPGFALRMPWGVRGTAPAVLEPDGTVTLLDAQGGVSSAGHVPVAEAPRMVRRDLVAVGGLAPNFPSLSLGEAGALLLGLFAVNQLELAMGVPGIDDALQSGEIRYERDDPLETWQPIRSLWRTKKGDCEDLAAAVAAELDRRGIPARPVVYRVRKGLAHAVVRLLDPRWLRYPVGSRLFGHPVIAPGIIDPSRTGGMGRP